MPSGKNRHRLEVSEERYQQVAALASREGSTVTAFADRLLGQAMAEYTQARKEHRHIFDNMLGGKLRGFCQRRNYGA